MDPYGRFPMLPRGTSSNAYLLLDDLAGFPVLIAVRDAVWPRVFERAACPRWIPIGTNGGGPSFRQRRVATGSRPRRRFYPTANSSCRVSSIVITLGRSRRSFVISITPLPTRDFLPMSHMPRRFRGSKDALGQRQSTADGSALSTGLRRVPETPSCGTNADISIKKGMTKGHVVAKCPGESNKRSESDAGWPDNVLRSRLTICPHLVMRLQPPTLERRDPVECLERC